MSTAEVTISAVITLTDNAALNVAELPAHDGPPAGPAPGRTGRREFRVLPQDGGRYPGRPQKHLAMFGILKVIVDPTPVGAGNSVVAS